MDFSKIEWLKKKFITLLVKFLTNTGSIRLLVKFITLSGSITLLVDFITLSGSITLSGVHDIIGAKYHNYYISRYSSSFYGGHFENRYPNPTGYIKWILAR